MLILFVGAGLVYGVMQNQHEQAQWMAVAQACSLDALTLTFSPKRKP